MDTKPEHENDNTFAKEALICEIGAKLKQAREQQGLSKEQVLKELKFNASFLDALESGRWSEMPGEVYALGFLRQYAEMLNLDFHDDIERIKSNHYELTTPLTYPDAPISPNRTWAVGAALLFVLGFLLSNLFDLGGREATTTHINEPSTPEESVSMPLPTPSSETLVAAQQNDSTNKASSGSNHHETQPSTPLMQNPHPTVPEKQQEEAAHTLHAYTFKAVSDDVWLQIFEQENEADEPVLKREALLRRGQSFSLDTSNPLLLTAGKPTALEVRKDGHIIYQVGSLGEENKVLKQFRLSSSP